MLHKNASLSFQFARPNPLAQDLLFTAAANPEELFNCWVVPPSAIAPADSREANALRLQLADSDGCTMILAMLGVRSVALAVIVEAGVAVRTDHALVNRSHYAAGE